MSVSPWRSNKQSRIDYFSWQSFSLCVAFSFCKCDITHSWKPSVHWIVFMLLGMSKQQATTEKLRDSREAETKPVHHIVYRRQGCSSRWLGEENLCRCFNCDSDGDRGNKSSEEFCFHSMLCHMHTFSTV